MADVPEYQRRAQIAPQTQSTGLQNAFTQVANSQAVGTHESFAEKLGYQIGQNAANQYAQKAAIKDANKEETGFFKASDFTFGKSGAIYDETYVKAKLQSQDFIGTQYLQKIYTEANNEPKMSASILSLFEENGDKGIKDRLLEVPEEHRPALERSLRETYNQGFNKLSHKLSEANFEMLKSQNARAYEQKFQMGIDAYLEGDEERGNQLIESATSIRNVGESRGFISPEQAYKSATVLSSKQAQARVNGKMLKKAAVGKGPEYLKSLLESDELSSLTPTQKMETVESARQTLAHYEAARSEEDFLIKSDLLHRLKIKTLTEEEALEGVKKLGPRDRMEVENAISEEGYKENKKTNDHLFVLKNLDKPLVLSSVPSAQISSTTQTLWDAAEKATGRELSLTEKAQIIQPMQVNNPLLVAQLSAAMESLQPALVADASKAIAYLYEPNGNPLSISGLSKPVLHTGIEIAEYIRSGKNVENAVSIGLRHPTGVPEDVARYRSQEVTKVFRDWNVTDGLITEAKSVLSDWESQVTEEVALAVYNNTVGAFIEKGNYEVAKKIGALETRRAFALSNATGGKKQEMRSAPNQWLPGGDQLAYHQILDLAAKTQEAVSKNKDNLFSYEMDIPKEREGFGGFIKDALFNPKEIRVKQVFHDPSNEVIEGNLVIRSDSLTVNPDRGSSIPPSWALYIETPSGLKPLLDAEYQPMRYTLDPKAFAAEQEEKNIQIREKYVTDYLSNKERAAAQVKNSTAQDVSLYD